MTQKRRHCKPGNSDAVEYICSMQCALIVGTQYIQKGHQANVEDKVGVE